MVCAFVCVCVCVRWGRAAHPKAPHPQAPSTRLSWPFAAAAVAAQRTFKVSLLCMVLRQRNSACVAEVHTPAKPVYGRHVAGTVVL